VYVHADVTAVFPWLTYALLSDPKIKRKPRRLYDAREDAVAVLQREVDKRRKKLASTIAYPLAGASDGEGARPGKGGRTGKKTSKRASATAR
jgi:deoxyhypusine synthase